MTATEKRRKRYDLILNEELGEHFTLKEGVIKEEQCVICVKVNRSICRLNINDEDRCNNFKKIDSR